MCNHGTTTNLPTPSWPAVHGLLVGFVACSRKGVLASSRWPRTIHARFFFLSLFLFFFCIITANDTKERMFFHEREGGWKLSGCFMVLIMTNRADFTISLLISKQSSALRFVSQSFRPSFLRNWSIEQFPPMFHPLIRLNIRNIAITMELKVKKKKGKEREKTRHVLKMDLNQIIRSRYSINYSIDRWILEEWSNWSNNVSMFVQTSCVKKIITIINIIHLIRAIIDTTRYKTRWKFIAPLLSLLSASEYLLEFEKNTLHCRASYFHSPLSLCFYA